MTEAKAVSIEVFEELFRKKLLDPKIAGSIAEFRGEENAAEGLWVSGESGNYVTEHVPAFNYYSESNSYELGIRKEINQWMESLGYYAEWHDPGTVLIYRL